MSEDPAQVVRVNGLDAVRSWESANEALLRTRMNLGNAALAFADTRLRLSGTDLEHAAVAYVCARLDYDAAERSHPSKVRVNAELPFRLAQERDGARSDDTGLATLKQLQADCSHHKTIRWAFRFSVCAVIMMISTMLFAGTLIVAAALRAPALPSKCVAPPPLERL